MNINQLRYYFSILVGVLSIVTLMVMASSFELPYYQKIIPKFITFSVYVFIALFLFVVSVFYARGIRIFLWGWFGCSIVVIGICIWFNLVLKWIVIGVGLLIFLRCVVYLWRLYSSGDITSSLFLNRLDKERFDFYLFIFGLGIIAIFWTGISIKLKAQKIRTARIALSNVSINSSELPKGNFISIDLSIPDFDIVLSSLVDDIAQELVRYAEKVNKIREVQKKAELSKPRRISKKTDIDRALNGFISHLDRAGRITGRSIINQFSVENIARDSVFNLIGLGSLSTLSGGIDQINTMISVSHELDKAMIELRRSISDILSNKSISYDQLTYDYLESICRNPVDWKAAKASLICSLYEKLGSPHSMRKAKLWKKVFTEWYMWFHVYINGEVQASPPLFTSSPSPFSGWCITVWSPTSGVKISKFYFDFKVFFKSLELQGSDREIREYLADNWGIPSNKALREGRIWRCYIGDNRYDAKASLLGKGFPINFFKNMHFEYKSSIIMGIPQSIWPTRLKLTYWQKNELIKMSKRATQLKEELEAIREKIFPIYLKFFDSMLPTPYVRNDKIKDFLIKLGYLEELRNLLDEKRFKSHLCRGSNGYWIYINFNSHVKSLKNLLSFCRSSAHNFNIHIDKCLYQLHYQLDELLSIKKS